MTSLKLISLIRRKIRKHSTFRQRLPRILRGTLATAVVLLGASPAAVVHAAPDDKVYAPAICQPLGTYDSTGIYYYPERVRNGSSNYKKVVCPLITDSFATGYRPLVIAGVSYYKPAGSPSLYCSLFMYAYDNTAFSVQSITDNSSMGGRQSMLFSSYSLGSTSSVVCTIPPGAELTSFYVKEVG